MVILIPGFISLEAKIAAFTFLESKNIFLLGPALRYLLV